MKIKLSKAKVTMSIAIFLVSIILMTVVFIQFKTVREVNESDIENLRESELKELVSTWKTKYQEINEQLEETELKIQEYNSKIEANEESSELLDEELEKSKLLLGKTDVAGEGVVITLSDNGDVRVEVADLLELINELRFAGAEAISINGVRVIATTDLVEVAGYILVKPEKRIVSPYVIKAIGNQTYLSSVLGLKNSGFIDKANNNGLIAKMEKQKSITIPKYSEQMSIKYMKEVEE